ncbi:MAG: acyltransferase family protein [Pseudomonadota bacterium]
MHEMSAHRSAAQTRPVRDLTIDIARGIAMILVVFGHALVGIVAAGDATATNRFLLLMIYSTHMSLFFLISGLLSQSFSRASWQKSGQSILFRMIWPYFLWSFILYTAHYVMNQYTNTQIDHYNVVSIFWQPPAVMWFLYVLFIAMLLRKALSPLPDAALAAIGVLVILTSYAIGPPQELRFVGVFLVAAALGLQRYPITLGVMPVTVSALIMAITAVLAWGEAVAWAEAPVRAYPAFEWIYLPALFAGPILLTRASAALSKLGGWLANALVFVGQRTMAIFVTHILITAGSRIALGLVGIDNLLLALIVGTVLGVGLPLIAAVVAERLRIAPLLGWR